MQSGKKNKGSILFIAPYPFGGAPGQRFRYEMYLDILQNEGYEINFNSFLNEESNKILYKSGKIFQKIRAVITGFLKRFFLLFYVKKYDHIFIFRESTPIGWPWFEYILSNVLQKKYTYDFDDAIWIPFESKQNKIVDSLRASWKVKYICKWAKQVVTGNEYLRSFAAEHNPNSIVIPTIVDTIGAHNVTKQQSTEELVVGWTGSHSTLLYLDIILEPLRNLSKKIKFTFLVIADKDPKLDLPNYQFVPWNPKTEISDLLKMNIGVMPLLEDDWSKGKCGFKAIQYLSLGIPSLVSPIGVNSEIVKDSQNGYLCSDLGEWEGKLKKLLNDHNLRTEFGKNGRQHIVNHYSKVATTAAFLALFNSDLG